MSINKIPHRFRRNLLTLAACAVVAPTATWALDLASVPPGTQEPYVAPNVIISIDDSGSMDFRLNETTGTPAADHSITAPDSITGAWDVKAARINILKYALKQVFSDTTILPDRKIRLAWQSMWNNGKSPDAKSVDSATMKTNSMRPLQGDLIAADSQRKNFINFVDSLKPASGTSSHLLFSQADAYMRRSLSASSPWSTNPGGSDAASTEYLGCRRNYHIVFTDGRWNGTASGDSQDDNSKSITLPDGGIYGSVSFSGRPNNNIYADAFANTLADWAFYSWSNPLQTSGLTGSIKPNAEYRRAPAVENFGVDSASKNVTLDRYWNPRYDPATWPHMVTYTIGISNDATTWPGAPTIIAPTQKVPFGYDNSFLDLASGNEKWPDMSIGESVRALDLWHAALNGRGRFYSVMTGRDLEKAFREIIGQINFSNEPETTSSAASGSNSSRHDVGTFTSAYEPANAWMGYVKAETMGSNGTVTAAWGGKTSAQLLDARAPNNRLILSWSDQLVTAGSTIKEKGGVAFKWATTQAYLSTAQNAKLGLNTSTPLVSSGQNVLAYIRGVRSYEAPASGANPAQPFRKRESVQGDIINSDIWYTGAPAGAYALQGYSKFVRAQKSRTPMIYVGGNDGMLHGFSAADGAEKIAYVPQGAIATLKDLASPSYNHQYYVDGSPMTGDVELGGVISGGSGSFYQPDWRTLLVGTLGAGGKGYFILDVTNPVAGGASLAPGFAEANADALVKVDRTRGRADERNCAALTNGSAQRTFCEKAADEEKDIGHITAKPVLDENDPTRTTQITRMNNGRWAVVMGNGYNSANQRPVLLVQYLDGSRELLRIPAVTTAPGTGNAKDNGLSAPRLVDLNGDGLIDVVYAGDNLGNMWKFDLTSDISSEWAVAFGGSPLFTAQGPSSLSASVRSKVQPITVAPVTRANDRKKCLQFQVVGGIKSCKADKVEAVGGLMVSFGTGRNVATDDPDSIDVQTLYSVLDNTRYQARYTDATKTQLKVCTYTGCPAPAALGIGVTTAGLAKRSIATANVTTSSGAAGAGRVVEDDGLYEVDDTHARYWLNAKHGWYMDLPVLGERSLKNMGMYENTNILMVYSQVPAKELDPNNTKETCESSSVNAERQYRTMINIMDGAKPSFQIIDAAGNGSYKSTDNDNASRVQVDKGSHSQIASSDSIMLDVSTCKEGKCLRKGVDRILRMPEQSLRPSWRQLK
ncbi:PilC/PilY family type IV pilus protein [Comamonas testosteroni]